MKNSHTMREKCFRMPQWACGSRGEQCLPRNSCVAFSLAVRLFWRKHAILVKSRPFCTILDLQLSFFWRSWSHRLWPKKLNASVAVPAAPVRVSSQRPLAPSVASVTLVANDKGDNEMILGAVHRSPGICLTVEENPRKPQLGDRPMKGLCDQASPHMGSLSFKWGR